MIDRYKQFACFGLTYDDLTATNLLQIEGVHRLTALQHHIIRDVHNVVDALNSHCCQTLDEPTGAGANMNPSDHSGQIEWAALGRTDLNSNALCRNTARFQRAWVGNVQRPRKKHGGLPCHANMPQAVGAIARHFNFNGCVVANRSR